MTSAELRADRNTLGVTAAWLAGHLQTTERTVLRWESEGPVPDWAAARIGELLEEADREVSQAVTAAVTGRTPYLLAYRRDEDVPGWSAACGGYPAAWHTRIAARAADELRASGRTVRIYYQDEVPEAGHLPDGGD